MNEVLNVLKVEQQSGIEHLVIGPLTKNYILNSQGQVGRVNVSSSEAQNIYHPGSGMADTVHLQGRPSATGYWVGATSETHVDQDRSRCQPLPWAWKEEMVVEGSHDCSVSSESFLVIEQ